MSQIPKYLVNFNRALVSPSKAKFQGEERPRLQRPLGSVLHDLGKPSQPVD